MPNYSGSPGLPPLKGGGDIGGGGGLVPQGSPGAGSVGGGGQPQDLDGCPSAVDPSGGGGGTGYDKSPNPWKYQSFQVL